MGQGKARNKGMRRSHLKAYSANVIHTGYRVDHGKVHELYKDKDLSRNEGDDQSIVDRFWGQERKRMPIGKRQYDDPKFQTELRLNAMRKEPDKKVCYQLLRKDPPVYLFHDEDETQFFLVKRHLGVASTSMTYGNKARLLTAWQIKKIVWVSHMAVRSRHPS
jgi:hypothetical protein